MVTDSYGALLSKGCKGIDKAQDIHPIKTKKKTVEDCCPWQNY